MCGYLHVDQLGTPRVMTTSTKAIGWSWNPDPWGNPGVGLSGFGPRMPGQYYDGLTGDYQNWNRDYNSTTGRYLQSDPIGLDSGINTYTYVNNNPLRYVDPLGLRPLTPAEKSALAPYIPGEDLNNADLHDGEVPWYLSSQMDGITRGNDIYFRPGKYDPCTPAGIALLGHELVHVGQYRNGMNWLTYLWSARHGYENSPYEQAAYAEQAQIQSDLSNPIFNFKGCGCGK